MRYRFLVRDYDGFSHSHEKECESDDAARKVAKRMVADVYFVELVTLYRLETDDSCGPIKYLDEFKYGEQ